MLKTLFGAPKPGLSDQEYIDLVKLQTNFLAISFIIFAVILFVASFPIYYFFGHIIGSFASGLYSGLFSGALAGKLMSIIYLSNPNWVHSQKIKNTDERVQYIRQRADALTLKILLVIFYLIFVVGCGYFPTYGWYLSAPLLLLLSLTYGLRWLLNKLL